MLRWGSANLIPPTERTWPGLVNHSEPRSCRRDLHSCGYYLANKGYDLRLIQDYLGHRDPKHTVHYTRTAASRFNGLWRR